MAKKKKLPPHVKREEHPPIAAPAAPIGGAAAEADMAPMAPVITTSPTPELPAPPQQEQPSPGPPHTPPSLRLGSTSTSAMSEELADPIEVYRSDARLVIRTKKRSGETVAVRNEPLPAQLDPTPNARGEQDYYRLLNNDDPKAKEWRYKLGNKLAESILKAEDVAGRTFMLTTFPRGYRLYEHVKRNVNEATGEAQKSVQSHARSPSDRQDAYLYGHPYGRQKRYRSPKDFFFHLHWLATDTTFNDENCTCKICCPWDMDEEVEKHGTAEEKEAWRLEKEAMAAEEAQKQAQRAQHKGQAAAAAKAKASGTPVPAPAPAPAAAAVRGPNTSAAADDDMLDDDDITDDGMSATSWQTRTSTSMGLPQVRCREQDVDLSYGVFIYRPGELVWFERTATSWGLCMILKRQLVTAAAATSTSPVQAPRYLVQPLTHPLATREAVIISREAQLRPWLGWSAPPLTHAALAAIANVTYKTVDWNGVLQGRFGAGDPEVDASVLAARAVDHAYTPFHLLPRRYGQPPNAQYWNGLFLGAEKIWVGEAVRLRGGGGEVDVLVVNEIIRTPREQVPARLIDDALNPLVTSLVGDVYTLATVPANMKKAARAALEQSEMTLPARMRFDLRLWNGQAGSSRFTWRLTRQAFTTGLADIKGRWYEASLLLNTLRGPPPTGAQAAKVEDTGKYLNSRGALIQADEHGLRDGLYCEHREKAFGQAIPAHTQLGEGLDDLAEMNGFPDQIATARNNNNVVAPAQLGGQAHGGGGGGGGGNHGYPIAAPLPQLQQQYVQQQQQQQYIHHPQQQIHHPQQQIHHPQQHVHHHHQQQQQQQQQQINTSFDQLMDFEPTVAHSGAGAGTGAGGLGGNIGGNYHR